jgi:hypothetical protein
MCSGEKQIYPDSSKQWKVSPRAAAPLTQVCTVGASGKHNSAWASGAPAGGRRVATHLGNAVGVLFVSIQNEKSTFEECYPKLVMIGKVRQKVYRTSRNSNFKK